MTQNYDDIFAQGASENLGEFFSFKNIGDRIAGTFVDLMEGIDGYNNPQYIIVLQRDGVKHRVGIRKTATFLLDKFNKVRFGQIIGLSFDEERPNSGRAATKIINLHQNPTLVDEQWIAQKKAIAATYGIAPEVALIPNWDTPESVPVPASQGATSTPTTVEVTPAVPTAPVSTAASPVSPDLLITIKTLIVNKGILTDAATEAEVLAKVREISGLELTAENGPAIINKVATAAL